MHLIGLSVILAFYVEFAGKVELDATISWDQTERKNFLWESKTINLRMPTWSFSRFCSQKGQVEIHLLKKPLYNNTSLLYNRYKNKRCYSYSSSSIRSEIFVESDSTNNFILSR